MSHRLATGLAPVESSPLSIAASRGDHEPPMEGTAAETTEEQEEERAQAS
jgi:hypothetical protein